LRASSGIWRRRLYGRVPEGLDSHLAHGRQEFSTRDSSSGVMGFGCLEKLPHEINKWIWENIANAARAGCVFRCVWKYYIRELVSGGFGQCFLEVEVATDITQKRGKWARVRRARGLLANWS
jgi:hypothetical protein